MTTTEAYELGKKARVEAERMDTRLASWETFKRSFGFFRFKRKHEFTQEHDDAFGRGFNGENL
jgi:hypothetical protein